MSSEDHTQTRRERIAAIREFADWLEAHDEAHLGTGTTINHAVTDAEEMSRLARSFGGCWEKHSDGLFFILRRTFGPLQYDLYASHRRICTARKVTKVETVTERDPMAVEAALAEIPETTRQIEVEEVEWDCPESLLDGAFGGEQ